MTTTEQVESMRDAVVLVTGGASGIGAAIVDAVLARGGRAVVWDLRDPDREHDRVHAARVDVSDQAAVDAAAAALPEGFAPTHLVNNAGIIGRRMGLADLDAAEIDRVLGVNLKSVLYVTRAFLASRSVHPDAAIVNLTSIAARTGGAPGNALYATTKGAIASLTRAAAKELAPEIRVNAMAPGVIDTAIQMDSLGDPAALEAMAEQIPLRRLGTAEEVAQTAAWLLSPASRYVTATIVDVAGGR
ncbi:MAG: SDR family NAD(P)-dependent oxidoreductase [Microbacterium sp.]